MSLDLPPLDTKRAFSLEDALATLVAEGFNVSEQITDLLKLMKDGDPKVALSAHRAYWTVMKDLAKMSLGTSRITRKNGKTSVSVTAPTISLQPVLSRLAKDNRTEREYATTVRPPTKSNNDAPNPDLPSPFDPPDDSDSEGVVPEGSSDETEV